MKRLFLSLILVAFAVSVQAADNKPAAKDAAKACPMSAQGKSCCPAGAAKQDTAAKVSSPKGAEQAKK